MNEVLKVINTTPDAPATERQNRIIFLDPVGSGIRDALVVGTLRSPVAIPDVPLFDQTDRTKVIGYAPQEPLTAVTALLHGQTEVILAGDIVSLTIDGETVWTEPAGKGK